MSAVQHVVLDELGTTCPVVQLEDDVRLALEASGLVAARPASGTDAGQIVGTSRSWQLVPSGLVGAIQIDDLLVEVRPKDKVPIAQLLFLLSYAHDPGFRLQDVVATESADLWAAFGETLARLAERATERGVLQGYVSLDETLRTVRGRIRMSDQLTQRPGQAFPIEVTHDDFTMDIVENRILRAAARRMLAVPRLPPDIRRRLTHLDHRLADVTLLTRSRQPPAWTPGRMNQKYLPALRIAEIILRNMVAEASPGRFSVASFAVDMARVFEDFTTTALSEALRRYPGRTTAQYSCHLDSPRNDGAPRIVMRPDILHQIDDLPSLIFDAKYKAATAGGRYGNADHYQMLAYSTVLGRIPAWLIYAGPGRPRRRNIVGTTTLITEYPIDVGRHPRDVLACFDDLAGSAMAMVEQRQSGLSRSDLGCRPRARHYSSPRAESISFSDTASGTTTASFRSVFRCNNWLRFRSKERIDSSGWMAKGR